MRAAKDDSADPARLENPATGLGRPRTRGLARAGFLLCVFLTVWTVKLSTIGRYGTDLPYWDQWAKEGELCFAPWFERHELWKNLFVPHNEHRIAPTLAMDLGLLRLGGDQWDARVQCAASAALHALLAAALAAWALRHLSRHQALAACAVIVLVTAPPIAWENVLGGFQSQFYFLAGFSLLSIGWLLNAPAFSARWLGGVACGALALVSMGSGLLVAAPIAFIAVLRAVDRQQRRDAVPTLAAALLLGGVGAWFRPEAPWHAPLHAHGLGEYLGYVIRCLSWPLYERPWLCAILWLPWTTLAVSRLKALRSATAYGDSAPPRSRAIDFCLAGGLWVLLQVAAVSYSRAGNGSMPAPRYGDICALGLFFNVAALALLSGPGQAAPETATTGRRWTGRALFALGCIWAVTVALSVTLATKASYQDPLPTKKAEAVGYERNVRAFVATNDYAAFAKADPIPFPSAEWLARILRNPTVHRLLPASVNESGRASALSRSVAWLTRHAAWLTLPALAGLIGIGWTLARTPVVACELARNAPRPARNLPQ